MQSIDLNADVGEGGADDQALIQVVTSVNIACGAHAGDDATMEAAVRGAAEGGVAIGAHPGNDHRASFGRQEIALAPAYAATLVEQQIARLDAAARRHQATLSYVKLHGALYHQASRDRQLAAALLDVVQRHPAQLAVLGMAGSELHHEARQRGVPFFNEAFADRVYLPDGTLAPRSTPGALLTDPAAVVNQALQIVLHGTAPCLGGGQVATPCHSLCLHGDSPHAAQRAQAISTALTAAGVSLRPFAPSC